MGDIDPRPAQEGAVALRFTRDGLKLWVHTIYPGVLIALIVAIAARFLSEHYGGPTMLFALLLGMAFNFLSEGGRCAPGISLASSQVLRLGVALLGLGLTVDQVVAYGLETVLLVAGSVLLTLGSGLVFSRLLGRGWRLGLLTGGAVGICGASAALAIASVLPKNAYSERNTIFTVIAVTTLSTLAMVVYPVIATVLGLDHTQSGIFFGATIHDVAQVVGAGYSVSDEAGNTATFVKMLRVSMLLPIVAGFAFLFRNHEGRESSGPLPVPWFVIAFALLVALGSLDGFPEAARQPVLDLSRWCLVVAISALGMKTSLKALSDVGGQAIALICGETLFLAALILGALALGW
ncbi:MAG: putative sulfate exporter family transporter [Methyloligellaceae bacterium]